MSARSWQNRAENLESTTSFQTLASSRLSGRFSQHGPAASLSWIVRDLWKNLEERQQEYEAQLAQGKLQAFETINRIASEVGARHGVFLQVNFPPGRSLADRGTIGRRDLSLLVYRDRKKFQGISEEELKQALQVLNPASFDRTGFGYEGFKVRLSTGRIDCLPGGIHLWCDITPEVLRVLDWLFEHAYQLKPPDPSDSQKHGKTARPGKTNS